MLARVTEMSIVIIWAHLCRNKHVFLKGIYRTLRVPKELAGKVLRKGMPIFCNELLWSAGLAALTQCYSTRGLEVVAGLNISNAICNLLNVVFVALGSAVGILIGQTLGASEYEKAKKDSFSLMWFTGAVCLLLAAILISVSGVFPKAYDTTAEVRNYGRWFITITAVFFPIQGFLNALYFTLRSGGKTMITFLFDSVFTWVIPIPAALADVSLHLAADPGHLCHCTGGGYSQGGDRVYSDSKGCMDQQSGRGDAVTSIFRKQHPKDRLFPKGGLFSVLLH